MSGPWTCRCGQRNSDWASECGRCERKPPASPAQARPSPFFEDARKAADAVNQWPAWKTGETQSRVQPAPSEAGTPPACVCDSPFFTLEGHDAGLWALCKQPGACRYDARQQAEAPPVGETAAPPVRVDECNFGYGARRDDGILPKGWARHTNWCAALRPSSPASPAPESREGGTPPVGETALDVVQRLMAWSHDERLGDGMLLRKAADEITRLRAALAERTQQVTALEQERDEARTIAARAKQERDDACDAYVRTLVQAEYRAEQAEQRAAQAERHDCEQWRADVVCCTACRATADEWDEAAEQRGRAAGLREAWMGAARLLGVAIEGRDVPLSILGLLGSFVARAAPLTQEQIAQYHADQLEQRATAQEAD